MTAPPPRLDTAAFAMLLQRAGLRLDAAQQQELYTVYGYFEAMTARNRAANRVRGAEPAHVFVPGQGWP